MSLLFHGIVHYRLWVATMVLSLGVFTSSCFGIPIDVRTLCILWSSTLFVYNADHVFDAKDGTTPHARWFALTGVSVLVALLFTVSVFVGFVVFVGIVLIFTYLLAPRVSRETRLLKAALFKPTFIGLSVAVAVTTIPALVFGAETSGFWSKRRFVELAARSLVLGLLCAANSLFCDAFDEDVDRVRGEATLAVLGGHHLARWVATVLTVGVVVATCLAYSFGWTTGFDARLAVTSSALATLVLGVVLPVSTRKMTASFLFDGALLLPALVGQFQSR